MYIRKISVGSDYKTSMHYIQGQEVLGGAYTIDQILYDVDSGSHYVYISNGDETVCWKSFNKNMPVSIEYNIDF